ncbi:peptide ABC transporter substrate-binding protein [Clostridiaceae bacterium 35-E11]
MIKKSVSLILVLMLTLVALAGCDQSKESQEDTQEAVLKWNIGSEPKTIDPQRNSAADGGHVINNIFEGLMREVNGELVNAIAESYDISEDRLTYTFHLRDAKWSDGQPVTAQNFEYAWKRALDPHLVPHPYEYAFQMFYIKGAQEAYEGNGSLDNVAINAVDEKTLEVTLNAPTEYFLYLTAFYTYMPVRKDMVEQDPENWAKNPKLAVSNGPFKLVEYRMGDRLVLEKNENYWNAEKVAIDRIEASMIVEESTALAAYESGKIDVNDHLPISEIARLQENDENFQILPELGTYYYIFNVTKAPTNDVRVRKALTMAIDRKAITEKITKAGELPATGFVPPGLTDAEGKEFRVVAGSYGLDPNAAQVEEAKKLLGEAGYPNGQGFPKIQIIYNTLERHKAVAEAVQEMWQQNLGINVELVKQDWAEFQDTRNKGNFTVARGGWLGDYPDLMTMLDLWLSYSGNNDAHWKNPKYDNLIEESKRLTGQERFQLLYEAEALMMNEKIVMPIYYYTRPQVVRARVKNWQKTRMSHWYFGEAFIKE